MKPEFLEIPTDPKRITPYSFTYFMVFLSLRNTFYIINARFGSSKRFPLMIEFIIRLPPTPGSPFYLYPRNLRLIYIRAPKDLRGFFNGFILNQVRAVGVVGAVVEIGAGKMEWYGWLVVVLGAGYIYRLILSIYPSSYIKSLILVTILKIKIT